jgi:hypothetical protein
MKKLLYASVAIMALAFAIPVSADDNIASIVQAGDTNTATQSQSGVGTN